LSAKVAGVDLDLTQASAGPRATGTAAQLFYAPADGTKGLSGSDLPVFLPGLLPGGPRAAVPAC